ncbi:MAG: hypothetical protein GY778_10995, partial [bacterium]|nr:hypothetical protein [bacterium]
MVLGIGDRDGDRIDDYVVAARFGAGGAGVAKLGSGSRLRTTGTDVEFNALGGQQFTGIGDSDGTGEGLADVALLPDVDGDAREEFVFAFPHVNGTRADLMGAPGHFNSGGIVVVSSRNSDFGTISLNQVGRGFDCEDGEPCRGRDSQETCNALWKPDDDPGAACFAAPLSVADCTAEPMWPCAQPRMWPGMWPGGEP